MNRRAMRPDPRSIPRTAKRRVKQTAARVGGVDRVRSELDAARADLTKVRANLKDARERHERTKDALASARKNRDTARERIKELEGLLEKERTGHRAAQDTLKKELRAEEKRRRAASERTTAFGYAYRRLRAAGLGADRPSHVGPAPGKAPEGDVATSHVRQLQDVHARAQVAEALALGQSLDEAVMGFIRASNHSPALRMDARRIAQSLYDTEGTRELGALATGLIAYQGGLSPFAWQRMKTVSDHLWLRHAASEYVHLAGMHGHEAVDRAVRAALDHPEELGADTWFGVTRRVLGLDLGEVCVDLTERFDRAATEELGREDVTDERASDLVLRRDWLHRWAPRVAAGPAGPAPTTEGAIPFAVLGYDQPDPQHTSSNIGDYVQTIASMSHLVRHTGIEFDDTPLGRFATELAARVPSELRVPSAPARVSLHHVDRDASSYSQVPDGTWLLAFGWYAHKIGGVRHDFPFPDHLRPLYVSVHINRRTMLTPEAIEHLRAHAPIGCRDHATVDLLLGQDIPAFFSGCLTTTVRYVRPEDTPPRPADAPTVWVDLPAPKGAVQVRNERPDVQFADLLDNLRTALASLDDYASTYGPVVTGRLHSYLPARALGCDVDFSPVNPSDIRFAGLAPLSDDEVFEMGRGIADLLEPCTAAILAGEDEERVREIWSEVTADLVAAARERHQASVELPAVVDVDEAVETIRSARVDVPRTQDGPAGEEMEIVLALDGNLKEQFLVVVDGLVEHASRPLHLNVLVREHEQADFDRAAALFPTVTFSWYPFDAVDYGDIQAMLEHITVSTMDRLLLPALLSDIDRVVYHDIDAVPLADIAELHDIDLQGHPIAARDAEASTWQSGYNSIFLPAAMRGLAPGMGTELIRRETARHRYDFTAFNAGIMVLDLARMREDRFCERFVPYANCFGMHDQQILNVYVGADRLSLDGAWNARPSQEDVVDPKIIHWAGGQKPWAQGYVSYKAAWRRHEEQLRRREAELASAVEGGPLGHGQADS